MSDSLRKAILDPNYPPLMSRWEVERVLGLNAPQLQMLVENGVLSRGPLGHDLFRTSEVRAFLERRR
jgi:hypothetical protein